MIIAIIVALALAFAVLAFSLKWQRKPRLDRDQQNIDIMRQEFVDLKAQLEGGELSQEEYQRAYDELVITLGNDLKSTDTSSTPRFQIGQGATLITLLVFLSAISFGLYFKLGTPGALNPSQQEASMEEAHKTAGINGMPSVDAMVEGLREKLQKDPDNLRGWLMLGRSYMVLKKYDLAVDALSHAYGLNSEDNNTLLFYADAITMQNGGVINDKAFKLVKRALDKDPTNPTALWMTAMAYEGKEDFKAAVTYWEKLLPIVKNNASDYQEVQIHLAHAQSRLTGKPMVMPPVATAQPASDKPAGGASVTAVIKLDAKYKQRVQPSDTVFVFARAVNGPRQPLAAKRLQVKDLPATVTLDDAMAMSPMNKLSDYAQVYIGARVSHSGNVMPSSGDLQGQSGSVATDKPNHTIEVLINQEVM
ncbi:MAG: c-type cytochrome biogenesis protein CcmI [Gammaproteobacteria bacterium]|nr:c-type cytochrome biogenesis protein CcmI [Gammaproteobacteria bacterium]